MSIDDFSSHSLTYAATSPLIPAPPAMSHPLCGPMQLLNLHLHETHRGITRSPEHTHEVYHIVLFEEADNQILVNHAPVSTHRGLCVVTSPGESHCFGPKRSGQTRYHALTFCFESMKAAPSIHDVLTHYTGIPLPHPTATSTIPEAAMAHVPAIVSACHSTASPAPITPARSAQLYHAVTAFMLFVAKHLTHTASTHTSGRPEEIARAYLDSHPMAHTSMAELAHIAHVTPAYLGRTFQKRYQISPGAYRDNLRMEAAKGLLHHSDLPIKAIAYDLGFPDASTFSKAFRRHTGHSPRTERDTETAPGT